MKFREYNNLKPVVITAYNKKDLELDIQREAREHNIIDLQFSTDYVVPSLGKSYFVYHALLLVEE